MTLTSPPTKKVIFQARNKGKNNTATKGHDPKSMPKSKIAPKRVKYPTLLQLKLTPERTNLWKTWLKYSRFEKTSSALEESLEKAIKFMEIRARAKKSWLADIIGREATNGI